jgi:bifunctional non-homologous end joining protein LigD
MSAVIEATGRSIDISKPDKVLFPGQGISKVELAEYYLELGDLMLPHVRERALTMHRFPAGIDEGGFYQKEIPEHFPDWVDRRSLPKEDGSVTYVVANDVATLVYLADQAVVTPHVMLSRIDRPEHPDRMVFDLDPPEDNDDTGQTRRAVTRVNDVLTDLELNAYVKTTGSKGYHIVVPLDRSTSFDEAHEFARDVGRVAAERHPGLLTVAQRKSDRGGRVFVDYLRNSYGQTTVAPYAVRALPGAPVATPLDSEEIGDTDPQDYTMANIRRRLAQKTDPWKELDGRSGHSLSAARDLLDAMASSPTGGDE